EDGIRDFHVTGVQTCALPIYAGNWADTQISVYNFEPFGARPGDLVYIHDHCGDQEDWQDYTIDVKAKLIGLVQDWTNGILKAACIVTGESIQFAKGEIGRAS